MHEDEIEDADIADQMLCPELIEAEACRSRIIENGRCGKRKGRAAKCPEVANIEKQEMEEKNVILQAKSETDALTGLSNRFRLNDYSEKVTA